MVRTRWLRVVRAGLVVATIAGATLAQPVVTETAEGQPTRSAERPTARTVVVVAAPDHPTLPLLRAELEQLGLRVEEIQAQDSGTSAMAATEGGSGADFRVVLGDGQIDVWIVDRSSGRVILREVFTQADGTPTESLTAVLHAVELLRWQLRAPAPQDPPAPVPRQAAAPIEPPTRRSGWMFSLVPQVTYSPGGTTAAAGAQVDLAWRRSSVAVRLFGSTAFLPHRRVEAEGTAEITPRFVGVQGVFVRGGDASPFTGSLGAGVTLVSTRLRATAEPGYRSANDYLFTVAPVIDGRVGVWLADGIALQSCASGMVPLHSDRIRFGEREVARHGELYTAVGLGVLFTSGGKR